ncbi:MAG: hypothetical protein MJZ48_00370 [Paludibacteraceae bacterium]|nr:hypothetical protein [Paludibacteraceae bacterium]
MEEKKLEFQEKCYEHIIHARDFHYEQFTQWSKYFYVIIGALFVGYYSIYDISQSIILAWVILGIGYVTSIANFLSIKGYMYWWQHWNILLANYEKKLCQENNGGGKIHGVFADKHTLHHPCSLVNGSNISTSKVALLLASFIVLAWSVLLGVQISGCCNCGCEMNNQCYFILCSLSMTLLFYVIGVVIMPLLPCLQSDITYHEDLELMKKNK